MLIVYSSCENSVNLHLTKNACLYIFIWNGIWLTCAAWSCESCFMNFWVRIYCRYSYWRRRWLIALFFGWKIAVPAGISQLKKRRIPRCFVDTEYIPIFCSPSAVILMSPYLYNKFRARCSIFFNQRQPVMSLYYLLVLILVRTNCRNQT